MEKFPPDSYEFKGFGILNLFDVTADQAIQNVNYNLIKRDINSFGELERMLFPQKISILIIVFCIMMT